MIETLIHKIGTLVVAVAITVSGFFAPTPQFGTAIPSIAALFETTLSNKVSTTDTTLTLTSATTVEGSTLPAGQYGFIIDEGTATQEFVLGTVSSTAVTNLVRGVSVINPNSTSSAMIFQHRRGASIKITNYPQLAILSRILNGTDSIENPLKYATTSASFITSSDQLTNKGYVDNRNGYWENSVANFAALPTGVTNGETRVTLDDSKIYVWNGSSWILAGSGGGAGTIYQDTYLGVSSTDRMTFSLSSGSWPSTMFLSVYRNGQMMELGDSADYIASSTGNTIKFNSAVGDTDKVTLRVESISYYNPAWGTVDGSLVPTITDTFDIGSSTRKFFNAFFGGSVSNTGTTTLSGSTIISGDTTTISSPNLNITGTTTHSGNTVFTGNNTLSTTTLSAGAGIKNSTGDSVIGGMSLIYATTTDFSIADPGENASSATMATTTIPANTITKNGGLMIRSGFSCGVTNNGSGTCYLQIKYGGTVIGSLYYSYTSSVGAGTAQGYATCYLHALNSTSSQMTTCYGYAYENQYPAMIYSDTASSIDITQDKYITFNAYRTGNTGFNTMNALGYGIYKLSGN